MLRTVLYVDPPAFCTTVEGLVAPALRARPVAVAAPGADRATILALSAEARSAGITRGMAVRQARKLCPDLILRPPNPQLYARASRALDEILRRYAPVIEPKGYGHAFLDLTGTGRLFGPAVDVAMRIQREARERLHLPLAAGVAQNKLVSQAASDVVKRRHDDILDIAAGTEAVFLAPESVTLLPDLDEPMRARLDDYQLEWIREIQAITIPALVSVFGSPGRLLGQHAQGIDPRPVLPPAVKAEFRAVHTLATDTNSLTELHRVLRHLTERLGARLRVRHLTARRMTVHLAYTDYTTSRRSVPLSLAALDHELWEAARHAFALARQRTVAIRALAVTVDRFLEADLQLELWKEVPSSEFQVPSAPASDSTLGTRNSELGTQHHPREKEAALQSAMDRIRNRWGARGVRMMS
jgi:DNA polymerase-4